MKKCELNQVAAEMSLLPDGRYRVAKTFETDDANWAFKCFGLPSQLIRPSKRRPWPEYEDRRQFRGRKL